jgi:LysM repeat protein
MKRIIVGLMLVQVLAGPARAQDAALVERVNRLSVYVDELLADKARQQQQITDLTREVERLRTQLERSDAAASREEVAALAAAVKQLEQKHRADIEFVADQVEKLRVVPQSSRASSPPASNARGYEYTIQPGNTLSAVAKAYQNQGIKVTVDDILKANPGLDPKRLQVGQVIFIPEP